MLVWVQGSLFHIAAGLHPVQEAWGSQDKLRTILTDFSCYITIQKKYSLTYLRHTIS